jgi:pilus assembly protein TadC
MDLLKFIGVVAIILTLHFLLWGQIYRGWLGHLKGFKKGLLFVACIVAEALITILLGVYILNFGQ